MQVFHLGRAPRTNETLLDFLKWRRVTRHPLVFRGLMGSQRTSGFWGVTIQINPFYGLIPLKTLMLISIRFMKLVYVLDFMDLGL